MMAAVISSSILISISPQVTAIVRKELAVAVRDLMHHGLNQVRVRKVRKLKLQLFAFTVVFVDVNQVALSVRSV